jgi:hypothetical protein
MVIARELSNCDYRLDAYSFVSRPADIIRYGGMSVKKGNPGHEVLLKPSKPALGTARTLW